MAARADVAPVKAWLNSYRQEEREIENQIERIETMQMRLESVSSPVLRDLPKTPSPEQDKLASLIAKKIDLEREVKDLIDQHAARRRQIDRVLSSLEQADARAVIRMRYLDCAEWDDVAFMLFGGRVDFLERRSSYIRRTHRIHSGALSDLALLDVTVHTL